MPTSDQARQALTDYELGHLNVPLTEAIRRLDERVRKDRRGNCNPEYGLMVGPGMYEEICAILAALRTPEPTSPSGGDAGAEAMRIPTYGFIRGAVVRETADGPNMLVVRGLGETTVVIVIEGDESGKVRLRERPTAALTQVHEPGDYARHRRSPVDWEPPTSALPQDQAPRQGGERP